MAKQIGYIKLSRRLLSNPIFKKPAYLSVWLYLLLNAQHQESSFIWNNKKQILGVGQLLTGRKKIAQITGLAESQIYKILKYLELEQQIEQQKTTKYTVITIVNWDRYQQKEQQKEQQRNNRVTTKEQQSNTYKNVNKNVSKNVNKNIQEYSYAKNLETILEVYNKLFNKSTTSVRGFEKNYLYWKDTYPLETIIKAIENASVDKFWKDKMTLTILFRQKNTNGEPVDYIGDLSSRSQIPSSGSIGII